MDIVKVAEHEVPFSRHKNSVRHHEKHFAVGFYT